MPNLVFYHFSVGTYNSLHICPTSYLVLENFYGDEEFHVDGFLGHGLPNMLME